MKYCGAVIAGKGFARELGFPTLNIAFSGTESGIFAGHVTIGENHVNRTLHVTKKWPAAIFADQERKLLEAHIIETFSDSPSTICIELLHKIREDKQFDSIVQLANAIKKDVERAKKLLKIQFDN